MKFASVALVALITTRATAWAQSEENWKRCRGNEPDVRIEACGILINSGQESQTDLASAHYARGSGFRQKGQFARALEEFNAAISANPLLIDAYGDRGITLTILGRFSEAIPDYTRVIETYPRLAYAYFNRGLCYELLGLDDLALEDISASVEIEPQAEFRYERRGTIYFRKKEFDRALADYEQALVINPQYAPALFGRGTIRVKNGDLEGGGADIDAAKHLSANVAVGAQCAADNKGDVYEDHTRRGARNHGHLFQRCLFSIHDRDLVRNIQGMSAGRRCQRVFVVEPHGGRVGCRHQRPDDDL
jgi:tetratricopeptide (TPR) repeat protein